MTNITVAGLPAKTGTIQDGAYLHLTESGVDTKVTIAQVKAKISSQYSSDINSFLSSTNKAAGRANLSIDRRVAVDNADYTILNTDKVVAQIGTMSAPRTFSLPAASTVQAGAEIIVIDESGSVNGTNKITVQRNGTDTIDGATSIDINTTYGALKLICDGANSWKVVINTSEVYSKGEVDTQINNNAIVKATKAQMQAETSDKYPDASILKHNKGIAKSWVIFEVNSGVISIIDSYNVTSVTRESAGKYYVNFSITFSNKPCVNGLMTMTSSSSSIGIRDEDLSGDKLTTSTVGIVTRYNTAGSGYYYDPKYIAVSAFGNIA
jgi:hypothetical protein